MSNIDKTTAERTRRYEDKKRKEGLKKAVLWVVDNPVAIQKVRDFTKEVNEEFKNVHPEKRQNDLQN